MLDNLSQRLARVVKTLRGEARLTESNTQEMLREVRMALLEADVAVSVVRDFIARVKEKALGESVLSSLSPGQALIGVVQRELTAIIGGDLGAQASELNLAVTPPATILMAGLQGAGKTTTVGKLAKLLKEKKKKILVASTDVYRPAALTQLQTLANQVGVDFFAAHTDQKPVAIALAALDWAKKHHHDVLIIDTAGRLAIDSALMEEIAAIHAAIHPAETLFVADAMLGQDAVNTAKAFNEQLPLTGIVLTKLDGDARGGAALSVRQITGKPIKLIGVGEKLDGLESFDAQRLANRILGMGDILALVEQAQRNTDAQETQKLVNKVKSGKSFDLTDFQLQLAQMKKMGSLDNLLDKLPIHLQPKSNQVDLERAEREMRRFEGIINSMTRQERSNPELIKASRKRRIATGAGVHVQEVNRLLNQFEQMRSMVKKMSNGGLSKLLRGMKGLSI